MATWRSHNGRHVRTSTSGVRHHWVPRHTTRLVNNGFPAELRLEIATHWPICGATPPPTQISTSSGSTGATSVWRLLGVFA